MRAERWMGGTALEPLQTVVRIFGTFVNDVGSHGRVVGI